MDRDDVAVVGAPCQRHHGQEPGLDLAARPGEHFEIVRLEHFRGGARSEGAQSLVGLEARTLRLEQPPHAFEAEQRDTAVPACEHGLLGDEARAAEANTRLQKLGADAIVEPHAARDLDHIRAGLLANVCDLVDERDLRRQERVGGELDHLRAGHVGTHERRLQRLVQRDHGVAGPAAVVSDDDTVGMQEVLDGRALLEELGAGDVGEALLALLAEDALQGRAGAAGHGRLHDQCPSAGCRNGVDDGVYRAQVGVSGVRRRGADGDEQQSTVLERVADVCREVQALGVARQQLLEPRLVDRDLAAAQALDLGGVDVDAPDVAAQLREAGSRHQAHIAGADHSDWLTCLTHEAGKASRCGR